MGNPLTSWAIHPTFPSKAAPRHLIMFIIDITLSCDSARRRGAEDMPSHCRGQCKTQTIDAHGHGSRPPQAMKLQQIPATIGTR